MSNIKLIKGLTYQCLSNFYFIDDSIVFFSENNIFRIHNNILYTGLFNKGENIILIVKIYNNYIHILAKSDRYYDRGYCILLYSICIENMIKHPANILLQMPIYKNILNFGKVVKVLDFIINNDNMLIITTEKNSIVYQFDLKQVELITEFVDKIYIKHINEHLEYQFKIQSTYKKQPGTIIGPRKSNNYYTLNIVSKYNPSIIFSTINIYDGNTFAIIDDHVIICDTNKYANPHIIYSIYEHLDNFKTTLDYKEIVEFCDKNKICIDFIIIHNNKKGQLICKNEQRNYFYILWFKKNIEHENSIIDYRIFKEMCKSFWYYYDIYYNNTNLKISKPYDNMFDLLKDFKKIE